MNNYENKKPHGQYSEANEEWIVNQAALLIVEIETYLTIHAQFEV